MPLKPRPNTAETVKSPASLWVARKPTITTSWQTEPAKIVRKPPIRSATRPVTRNQDCWKNGRHLLPKYDDPEFVVPNIWHLYAGWFRREPRPSHTCPRDRTGDRVSFLAGGADKLARRAALLAQGGRTRLAAHLAELAAASPQDRAIQATRASIYERCAEAETSLIEKALFAVYPREAKGEIDLLRGPAECGPFTHLSRSLAAPARSVMGRYTARSPRPGR